MLNSVPSSIVEVARCPAAAGRPSCAAAGQQHRHALLGKPQRQRQVQEGVVARAAAEGADQHQRGRAARERLVDGEFAVGLVLVRRETVLRGTAASCGGSVVGTESKSPTHSSGTTPSVVGMAHARHRPR